MRVRKIQYKDGRVSINWETEKDGDAFSLSCRARPRPEFILAWDAMRTWVVELCELPQEYLSRIAVTGVTTSYAGEKDVRGVVLTATMRLDLSLSPLNLNTPHKTETFYGETGDDRQLMDDDLIKDLDVLELEAEAYVKGERAQSDLPFPQEG